MATKRQCEYVSTEIVLGANIIMAAMEGLKVE